ncbi:hypothetical protein FRC01_011551, partial [Tulasnella sp. 417]
MSNASFYKRFQDARSVAVSILESTDWPPRSKAAAANLLQVINHSPLAQNLSEDTVGIPEDLRDALEQFTRVLQEVATKLEKVASKYGTRRRGVRDRIKYYLAMLRPGRCIQVLQTCEDDVDKASASVGHSIDRAGQNSAVSKRGAESEAIIPTVEKNRTAAITEETHEAAAGTLKQPDVPGVPPPAPLLQPNTKQSQPNDLGTELSKDTGRREALEIARKVFSSVEAASGLIPAVGDYIGAGAKVGLACVEMAQVMHDNEDTAEELMSRTDELSDLLKPFGQRSYEPEKEKATNLVQELQRQLRLVQSEIKKLQSAGSWAKFMSSGERAEVLKEWKEKIQTTMDNIQANIATLRKEREDLTDRLGDGNYGARDSEMENVICLPGTRVDILARINDWVKGDRSERVFWLRGMAGRGKSAIASTVAYGWREQKASCALFHFRRGQTALSSRLVCALARQLICHGTPEVKEAVLQAVRDNRDVATMRLEDQFKILLVDSLARLGEDCAPVLLAIDALDECEGPKYAERFINAIARHTSSFRVRVRFLLTSRPEDALVRALRPKGWGEGDLDDAAGTVQDITMFLHNGLLRIGKEHGLGDDWPSEQDVKSLAELSQGLFQWANTALKYIGQKLPEDRLRALLDAPSQWAGLDDLYHQILAQAFFRPKLAAREAQFLCRVLGIIIGAPYAVSLEIVSYLCADYERLANKKPDEIAKFIRWEVLGDLGSILFMPISPGGALQFMHTSIRDLLIDPERCAQKPYFIDHLHHHQNIALRCIALMQNNLQKNICGLTDLSKSNLDPDVQNLIQQHVPRGLQYCCCAWPTHLAAWLHDSQLDSSSGKIM